MKRIVLLIALTCSVAYPAHEPVSEGWRAKTEKADYIHRAMKQVTDVMVHDIYSPPVTSAFPIPGPTNSQNLLRNRR